MLDIYFILSKYVEQFVELKIKIKILQIKPSLQGSRKKQGKEEKNGAVWCD